MLRSTILSKMSESLLENNLRFKQLEELDSEINWKSLVELIDPHHLATNIGKNLISTETMLRIFFLQIRYGMSASGVEDALFQIDILRSFALIDINKDIIPSEVHIESFNQLLSEHDLKEKIIRNFNLDSIS